MQVRQDLEEFVPVPEGRMHFAKIGSGPSLVIFHAGGSAISSWVPMMESLGQHFTCYGFDQLGHGESDEPPRESFSIPDHARSMDHAMQVLNIHRAHVIGHAAGASLALEMAASYPDRVDRLVLVTTPLGDPRITPQRVADTAHIWDESGRPLRQSAEQMKAAKHFFNPKPEWVDQLNDTRGRAGKWTRIHQATTTWYDMVARFPLVTAAATLVLNGSDSRFREIEDILVYNLPNASKVVLPGTGNFAYIEDPEGFAAAVVDFLK